MSVKMMKLILFSCVWLTLGGCVATVGADTMSVPKDSARICANHCLSIGMRLTAVAIMANNVGCVCEHTGPTTAGETSSPVAGMSTILMQQAADDAARQQQAQAH